MSVSFEIQAKEGMLIQLRTMERYYTLPMGPHRHVTGKRDNYGLLLKQCPSLYVWGGTSQ